MAFKSNIATSVGADEFEDRHLFEYFGLLDEFSEDGILLFRAPDSIIFREEAQPGDNTEQVDPNKAKPNPTSATPASASAPPTTTTDQPDEPSSDDQNEFTPDPAFAAATASFGLSQDMAADLEKKSRSALATISFNRALFSVRDFEKEISKSPDSSVLKKTSWPAIREHLFKSLNLTNLTPEQGFTPNAMFAPQDFIELESEMIELAKRETDAHTIPEELVNEVLASKPTMAEEQKIAAIASCSGNKAVVVTEGTAGAGKSFTLNAIREIYEKIPPKNPGDEIGYDIIGTALSWTATKVLEESAGLSGGRAIQGLTMAMEEAKSAGGDFFKRRTILIVDEAGLVGVKHMHKILWHAANSKHPVRVLLTGDSLQLCPVEAGNALEAIVDECGSSRLDTIRRQKQASHRAAVKHFCYGRSEHALWTFWQQEAIHFSANADERRELVMRDYVRYCLSNPSDVALVLALENTEVKRLNSEIRERLKLVGRLLGDEHEMTVTDGRGAYVANFCVGDQIVLRKNKVDHPVYKSQFAKIFNGAAAAHFRGEKQASRGFFERMINQWKKEKRNQDGGTQEEIRHGIFNRTTGLIIDIKKNPDDPSALLIRILLNEGGEVEIDTRQYIDDKAGAVPLHHNFATTIYASQGQTVQKVLIMDSPYMARRLAYVGMSRHTMMCDIYVDCLEIQHRISKEGTRQVERAWNRFETDTKNDKGHEQLRLAKLKQVISEWAPSGANGTLKPTDYLKAMAVAWNQDSPNPTIFIAQKQMNRKKEVIASGGDVGMPKLCLDDDPDDHLEPRLPEPYLFEDLEHAVEPPKKQSFLAQLAAKKKGEPEPVDLVLTPLVTRDNREKSSLPEWCSDPLVADALSALQGTVFSYNRYGYPRFNSIDPIHAKPTSRWGLDGSLKTGAGEVAVLLNSVNPTQSPWMVVAGPKEALISYTHYRRNPKSDSSIPNIVAAPPACDLRSLEKWVIPGTSTLYCAWSPKRPETMARAEEICKALRVLGHAATLYPPKPTAHAASTPQRQRTRI